MWRRRGVTGSLRQIGDNKWELRVSLGADPVTGRYRQKSKTVRGTRRAAEKALAALVTDAERQVLHVGPDVTIATLLAMWLDGAHLADSTRNEYQSKIATHILPRWGTTKVGKVKVWEVERWLDGLADTLAPNTIRQVHAIIRRAYNTAVRWGWITTNPFATAQGVSVPKRQTTEPTPEQMRALLVGAERYGKQSGLIVWLAIATGARRGEVCGLRWSDLNTIAGTITVARSIGPNGPKSTKTHAERTLSLDPHTVVLLAEHYGRLAQRAIDNGHELHPDAYMFPSPRCLDGLTYTRPDTVSTMWSRVRTRAGLPKIRLHDLRHFAASHQIAAGIDVVTVAGRLGHRDPAVTLGIYAHAVAARDQAAAAVMGELLSPGS